MEEMSSLHKNDTRKKSELPKRKKAIGCTWVFAQKQGTLDGDNVHYKTRLVTIGYVQREGIDNNVIFLSVVKYSSIRILLALVAQYELELDHLDVNTAFLYGDLYKEIFMSQPTQFKTAEKEI